MNFGFKEQSEGLLINNLFFPASEQALAYLSSIDGKTNRELFEKEAKKLTSAQFQTQTPLLQHLSHQEMPYETMMRFFTEHFGTAKGLTSSLVQHSDEGIIANITRQNRATLTVKSRFHGQKSRPLKITINRPIIKSIDDVSSMSFDGANAFEQHSGGRADPLSPGLLIDDAFLRGSKYASVFDDKQIVGHRRGAALAALANGIKNDNVNFRAERHVEGHVFLPFDFAKRPDLAFEIALMRYSPSWFTKATTGLPTYSMLDTDKFLHAKSGYQTADYNRAIRSGKGFVSSLVSERFFPSGAAYIMHSMIEHNLALKKRQFAGMASLFEGTPNRTIAPRFIEPTKTGPSPLEVYIIGDSNIPGPAVMYANFESKLLDSSKYGKVRNLQVPLIEKLNPSLKWCVDHNYNQKLFTMTDRLGRVAMCVIYRASDEIFSTAASLARKAESNYSIELLKSRYQQRLQDAKNASRSV